MTIIWRAIIKDEFGNIKHYSSEFSKKWLAEKWASKMIDKHKKLNEWFYEVQCEIRKDKMKND